MAANAGTGTETGAPGAAVGAVVGAPVDVASATLWAPRAWVGERWEERVLLRIGKDGHWVSVQPGADAPADASILPGPVLPGMVNAHSHAFQRAFAGLAERRRAGNDDFWSWRDRMYAVALRVSPEQQHAIAAQLYLELLRGGYTHVCEFHYLHRAFDGGDYPDGALPMAQAIAQAADETGIGLTLLPVIYERAGFGAAALQPDQRRFRADARAVLEMRAALRAALISKGAAAVHAGAQAVQRVGLALHSLRAATPGAIEVLRAAADEQNGPIHIHIAEQRREVEDCVAATGLRPIEWLCRHAAPDARWHLVHATHATAAEIATVGRCGAGIVICPSTEANLGDGIVDLPAWLAERVPIAVGSDSHVTRSVPEELRLLDYSQRLARRERCVAAAPDKLGGSTAARLWNEAQRGGAAAAGFSHWGLAAGARADLLVIDTRAPALLGMPASYLLDALVFSSPVRPFRDIMVAGRWVSRDHRSPQAGAVGQRFAATMGELWQGIDTA